MKYMTKEWYKTMQKQDYYTIIKHIDENTKNFSEDYFNKLYIKEKQIKEKSFHFGEPEMYKDFNHYFDSMLDKIRELPDTVINEINDIRFIALGYSTQKSYDKIKEYCINNQRAVEKTMDDYNEYMQKQFKNKIPDFEKESFHDNQITNFAKKGNDYIIEIDNEGAFTEINNIVFKNAEIVKQEEPIEKAWWLYKEIYQIDNKYEIHFLLWSDDALNDLILICDDIILN